MFGQIHVLTHRITYSECTVGDHVYYARYLDFLEAARGDFFRAVGLPFRALQDQDTALPVIECALQYKAAARYDDVLAVEVWITELARVRLTFGYRVLKAEGQVVLTATTVHACTNLSARLKRLPEDLSERLRPFLQAGNDSTGAPCPSAQQIVPPVQR
jgi:acyl-CoA thioester hydrolase